jgi:uncharacterized protein (TIRG00374 family)
VAASRRTKTVGATLVWAGLAISALFAYLAVRNVSWSSVWRALRESNYWWLLPGLAVLAVAILARALRWRYLFARETRPGVWPVTSALIVGLLFNNILPARAGEAARVVALNQHAGTSRAEAAATVVIERAYDVLLLLVLLFVGLPWLPHVTWLRAAAILAIGVTVALVGAAVALAVWGERPLRFVLRPVARLPFLHAERLEHAAANLGKGFAAVRQPRLVLGAIAWTTASWLLLALSSWFVLLGFPIRHSFGEAVLVVIAVNLGMILPSSPAAVGVWEKTALVALGAYGISDSAALPYALVLHAVNVVPTLVVGFPVLHRYALSLRRSRLVA